jgi:hypothetical protein
LRNAERQTKARWPSILKVGDPLLDLVGIVVGGVIAAFGEVGGDDDLVEALAQLKETPRSHDHPVYRAYTFERSTVRAGKEAVIPLVLSDLTRGRVWRTNLRQREMREFAVLEGLDARDRDYQQHCAGALGWQEFEHWERQPPQLPLSALVETDGAGGQTGAAQLGAGRRRGAARHGLPSAAAETPALDPPPAAVAPTAGLPRIEWEQSAGPSAQSRPRRAGAFGPSAAAGGSRETNARSEQTVLAALDQRVASVVRMAVDGRQGSGLYVKPRLLVTTGELVGSASMVEVTTSDGEEVLGLVVHVDPARNLALVHVPRSGRSAPVAAAPAVGPGHTIELVELVGGGRARVLRAVLRAHHKAATGSRTLCRRFIWSSGRRARLEPRARRCSWTSRRSV